MEVDEAPNVREGAGDPADEEISAKTNGEVLNHIDQNKQNGYPEAESSSKSESSKDKHSSSKHSSSSDKKHGSSSSSSSKHHSSSSSSKHRDGHSSSSSHKHSSSSSSSSKHRDGHSGDKKSHSSSSSDRHKDGSTSSSSKDKHHSSSSSSRDKDKHHSSSSSSKDKHHSSSGGGSSDKHKHGSSSSKHSSSSSSHKSRDDKHGDKSKDHKHSSSSSHKSSSSSTNKHGSSSDGKKENVESDKEKERQARKEKERQERKEKERKERKERERKEREKKENGEAEVKEEPKSPEKRAHSPIKSSPEKPSPVKPSPEKVKQEVVKQEPESSDDEDDTPLSVRLKQEVDQKPVKKEKPTPEPKAVKRAREDSDEDDDDDVPLSARVEKVKKVKKETTKKRKADDSEDEKPIKKKKTKPAAKTAVKTEQASPTKKKGKKEDTTEVWKWWEEEEKEDGVNVMKKKKTKPAAKTAVKTEQASPTKKKGKKEDTTEVWKWWEEEKKEDGVKWNFLEHKGPVFAPAYEPIPKDVQFYYNGKPIALSQDAEEVATFYAKMLEHDYTTKDVFNNNFLKDWRKTMTSKEKELITDLKKCNFKEMCEYFKGETEKRKNRTKEEKLKLKEENAALQEEYGICIMDGHKEKIGNFRIEPPGLFRGRGDHPKQGMHKKRTLPEDVIINCSKDSNIPQPPAGHKWKRVQHDHAVSWLASWNENVQGQTKYVMLNPASRLKGEKDWMKYETARRLHKCVDKIRAQYQEDWKSKEMRIRQRAVALYFIDKLALRAGNEKDEGETADTVGCCSLRYEHVKLHIEQDGKQNVVEFDFLGKDSIRYQNSVSVEKRVFKNLQMFVENKNDGDDLFDRLNTTILNKHLHELMDGLTAKVFRTYNASRTLQEQLDIMTNEEDPIPAKMLSYNRANRAVAILCNHQRAAPKNFSKQMENIMAKIKEKRGQVKEAKKQLKDAKTLFKKEKTQKNKMVYEKKKKAHERIEEQLTKLEVQATDKDENKEIALGTSKLNYLDPRISVAWCKKWDVPLEKVYNKTQREKFRWAIDMATPDFQF